ncbi:hypothetical protein C0030_006180 [Candidatus Liberibacter solanacearum]|uniref:Uncharacterized protein n=1 Tax=Candidatus Liberibacter solanacearum TaxID=556287 RepID=A0A3R7R8T2_9HYPH|nr:hypothetical protein C0030_006180 [Candidatus Liberibacter solanacearum]
MEVMNATISHIGADVVDFKDWLHMVTHGYTWILRSVTTKSAFKSILRYLDLILGFLVTLLHFFATFYACEKQYIRIKAYVCIYTGGLSERSVTV